MQEWLILHFNHYFIIMAKWLDANKKKHFMELILLKKKKIKYKKQHLLPFLIGEKLLNRVSGSFPLGNVIFCSTIPGAGVLTKTLQQLLCQKITQNPLQNFQTSVMHANHWKHNLLLCASTPTQSKSIEPISTAIKPEEGLDRRVSRPHCPPGAEPMQWASARLGFLLASIWEEGYL